MRIFYLAHANSIHSHRWIRFFADRGHTILWVSVTEPLNTDVVHHKNVIFLSLGESIYRLPVIGPLAIVKKLKRELSRFNPDVFHIHYAGFNGALGALIGFHPLVVTAWGSDVLFAGKSFWKSFFVKKILKAADVITCDAEHMKHAIMKFTIEKERINIIQFGIDTKKFIPKKKTKGLRERLGISEGPVIISMRTFEPVYDIATLINAFALVHAKIPNAHLVLIGKGSQEENLKILSEKLNIAGSVAFIGFVPNDELPDYLCASDVYVSTSLSDAGIASSTAEAMACGIPVVITDCCDNSDWISDGKNGLLFPMKDSARLAEKILFLLNDPELQTRIAREGRKTIEDRDDYYREMEKMEKIYERLAR